MSNINNIITDNIDVWASAIKKRNATGRRSSKKIELTGIKKLRELILELAVRGKLVPQGSGDEPASVLLEKIAAEKAQLIADKKIKKTKALPEITDEDKPFELPHGWEWVSFGSVCEIERGGSPRPIKSFITDDEDGLNWIKIGDTDIGGKYITSTAEKITKEGLKKTREVFPGDFLLTNSMSFGRPYITKIKGCIHDGWLRISPPASLDKDYLYSLLSSPFIIRAFKKTASGAVVMNLNADKVRAVTIAMPPINEQHRIVAKVDELMVLCDQLEQQTEQSLSAHQTLVEVLLAALTESKNVNDFQTSWQRISEHFDVLFTTEHSIEQLKQTILQLAVMGKLVPQNLSDEPASVLLEKIAAEKAQLIADKKIKKQKPLPAITDEEKPFELPSGWEWTRLEGAALTSEAGWSPRCLPTPRENDKWGVLKVSAVSWGIFNPDENKELPSGLEPRPQCEVHSGDFLISRANTAELVARAVIVPGDVPPNLMMSDKIIRFSLSPRIEGSYISLVNNSRFSRSYYAAVAGGTSSTMKNVSREQIRSLVVALPPLAEQQRIVAKVDELMALCEQLKARLSDAETTQLHLADAVVENVLGIH